MKFKISIMTCKDYVRSNLPELIDDLKGGVSGCPDTIGFCIIEHCAFDNENACTTCWNQPARRNSDKHYLMKVKVTK